MQIIDPLEAWLLGELRRHAPRTLSLEEIARAALANRQTWAGEPVAAPGAAVIDDDWRRLLPRLRHVATSLAGRGALVFLRKGKVTDPAALKGVFRIKYNDIYEKLDSIS